MRVHPGTAARYFNRRRLLATMCGTSQTRFFLSHCAPLANSSERVALESGGIRNAMTVRWRDATGVDSTMSSTVVWRVLPSSESRCRTQTSWSPYLRAKRFAPSCPGAYFLATRSRSNGRSVLFTSCTPRSLAMRPGRPAHAAACLWHRPSACDGPRCRHGALPARSRRARREPRS